MEAKAAQFARFANCYMAVCECLREESDLQRLVLEVAEDAAKSGRIDEKRWFQSDGIDFTGAKLVETSSDNKGAAISLESKGTTLLLLDGCLKVLFG